ncbi:hypothetical protein H4R35_003641 [Dimargaris xerosporica]|nr:hypothetical protein H4R35_003641 [Dimargaris xerosporica]
MYATTTSPLRKGFEPRPLRGMRDLWGEDALKHGQVVSVARGLAQQYGFEPIETPLLEFSQVYQKTLGVDSDVIQKELYSFVDKDGASVTLKPEGTAGVARALLSGGFHTAHQLHKFYYHGPMFRRERPQKGRLRQFHQFGLEFFGSTHPSVELELIAVAHRVLSALKVRSLAQLQVNTLGDYAARQRYLGALTRYLQQNVDQLSPESQRRLGSNSPLRVLDSKAPADRAVVSQGPVLAEYLGTTAKAHFDTLCQGLQSLDIPMQVNPYLVRGLEFYEGPVWEFVCAEHAELGESQVAILAGGRYDGLTKMLGSAQPIPGAGWALGLERLVAILPPSVIEDAVRPRPIVVVPVFDKPTNTSTATDSHGTESAASDLTRNSAVVTYSQRVRETIVQALSQHPGSVIGTQPVLLHHTPTPAAQSTRKAMAKTAQANPRFVILVGSQEQQNNNVTLKDMDQGTQQQCTLPEALTQLATLTTTSFQSPHT